MLDSALLRAPVLDHRRLDLRAAERVRYVLEQSFRYEYDAPVSQLRHRLVIVPPARHGRQPTRTASDQLDAAGHDPSRLLGVLITHSHWDHVSGLDQLQVPIWTNDGELQYAADERDGAVFRTVSPGHQVHRYVFAAAPYLGFTSSYDVHGDGSIVLTLAGGHTTGSVIVFVTLPAGQRYAFIGDVTWQLEGVTRPAERPWLMRKLADVDPARVRQDLLQVASLAGLVQVVPAHDVNAYDGIPLLTAGTTTSIKSGPPL